MSIKPFAPFTAIVVISILIWFKNEDYYHHPLISSTHNTIHSPKEWLQTYTCSGTKPNTSGLIRWFRADLCQREPSGWRHKYIEEEAQSNVLVKEDSIDERLANRIFTTTTVQWFTTDHFKFNSGDRQEDEANKRTVAGSQVDNAKCGQHLWQMIDLMKDLETRVAEKRRWNDFNVDLNVSHFHLARILDTFGRFESGFLVSGKTQSMGSYERCSKGELLFDSTSGGVHERVKTRFCWARLRADEHLDESLRSRTKSQFDNQDNSILTGICLPETCHSITYENNKQLLQLIVNSQFRLPNSVYINETLELESIYCLPDDESDFSIPLPGKMLILALVGWFVMSIYATVININKSPNEKERNKLTRAMDLIDSWREFVETNDNSVTIQQPTSPASVVDMSIMDLVKVLSLMVIFLAHSFYISIGYSSDLLRTNYIMDSADLLATITVVSSLLVDTFFMLTSLIVSYFTLKKLKRQLAGEEMFEEGNVCRLCKQATFILSFCCSLTLKRYLRLIPMFAIVHWFKKYVWIFAGWGPLWDHGFNRDTPAGICRQQESWLVPLTFWSAYLPLAKQCLLQSWSISSDLFFCFLMGPLIIAIYHMDLKWALWTTLAISSTVPLVVFNFDLMFISTTVELYNDLMDVGKLTYLKILTLVSQLYTSPIYHLPSYIIGTLAGYYLFKFEERQKHQQTDLSNVNWASKLVTSKQLTIISFILLILPILSKMCLSTLVQFTAPYHSIFLLLMPLCRLIWCLNNVVLFIRMATDWQHSRIVRFYSKRKLWKIIRKLNYLMLLLHFDLMIAYYYSFNANRTQHSSWLVIQMASTIYLLTVPISILLHVVFESPINKLLTAYLHKI